MNRPAIQIRNQAFGSRGKAIFLTSKTTSRVSAPIAVRQKATPVAGKVLSPTAMNRKDDPQIVPKNRNL
jgi:hypothetical protein